MLHTCIVDDEDFDPNAADSDDDGGDDNSSDSSDDDDEEEADENHNSNDKRPSTQSKVRNISTKQSARKAIPVKGKVAIKTPTSSTSTASSTGTAVKPIKTEQSKSSTVSNPNHIIDFTTTSSSSSPGTDNSDYTGKISHTDMVIDVSECEEKEAGQGDRRTDDVCVLDGEEVPDYPSSKRVKVEQLALGDDVVITIA